MVDKKISRVRARGEPVRRFLIENIEAHPTDIVRITAEKFGCTRQAVHKHLQRLVAEGAVAVTGTTRSKRYTLATLVEWAGEYQLSPQLTEDTVWRRDISPLIGMLPGNVVEIWHYGFTEMFNNVCDHSEAESVHVKLSKTAASTRVQIFDDGVGIFRKIQAALGLDDARHAVLELAKGKFTTDPANHSGEGIFFTSRMFDEFDILSRDVFFSHEFDEKEDWILDRSEKPIHGTLVMMILHNHTARTVRKVFDKFSSEEEDYGFTKTLVPVKLLRYGDDNLVSRSQAKRLLTRFEKFKVVLLDFSGVANIGQAFADEVFRVFRARHPEVELHAINASSEVRRMMKRAETHASAASDSTES
jgi:anti-sigma regulatory factor (Ser/Thr protein kinase)/biotin operon repressor